MVVMIVRSNVVSLDADEAVMAMVVLITNMNMMMMLITITTKQWHCVSDERDMRYKWSC